MKKFLFQVSVFTFLLTMVSGYSFWVVEKYYHSGSGYSDVDLSYDHYILADSHANALEGNVEKYGIHHFAYGSDSYLDMERKLSYLIKYAEVETVFLTISDQALSSYREIQNNLDRSIQFDNPENYGNLYEYAKVKYIERYITLLNPKVRSLVRVYTQNIIMDFLNGTMPGGTINESIDAKKIQKVNKTWADFSIQERQKRAKSRFDVQFPSFKESVVLKKSLKDIIDISKKADVRLIGIKFPMSNEYLELKNGRSFSGSEMLSEAGFEVYNLEEIYTGNQNKFQDQDHLTDEAGEQFSSIINQILLDKK